MRSNKVEFRKESFFDPEGSKLLDFDLKSEIRFGSLCPKCKQGIIDYDGMLNLVCPNCGVTSGGCFT